MTLRPHPIRVPEATLVDLRERLERSRWPEAATDPAQGIGSHVLRPIIARWASHYDWRRCEQELERAGSAMFTVDDLDVHFLHVRSLHADAQPLVLTHGWPGSVVEFLDAIPALTDPQDGGPAFHVVVPSLPGYGFSGKPTRAGWNVPAIADAWHALMTALDYPRYVAQGGDWGAMVAIELLRRHPDACRAIHLNLVLAEPPPEVLAAPSDEERAALASLKAHRATGSGYAAVQSTKPQALGFALVDSPLGLAAWILDRMAAWTPHPDPSEPNFGGIAVDRLLDNLTLWWVTASATSAARLYWESYRAADLGAVAGAVGCTIYPNEIARPSHRWAAARFQNLIHYAKAEAGGHFPALEQPALFASELRAFASKLQGSSP